MLTIWKTVAQEEAQVLEVYAREAVTTLGGPLTLERVFTLRRDRTPALFANPGWTNDDLMAALAGWLGCDPALVQMAAPLPMEERQP